MQPSALQHIVAPCSSHSQLAAERQYAEQGRLEVQEQLVAGLTPLVVELRPSSEEEQAVGESPCSDSRLARGQQWYQGTPEEQP